MKRYGITVGDNIKLNVRLVDCVGYLVNNAIGYLEDDMPRMVKTPWSTERQMCIRDRVNRGNSI